MPDEQIETPPDTSVTDELPPETSGADTPPPADASPAAPEKKVISMTSDTVGRIRAEERSKGKAAALAELNAQAQRLGFKDNAELLAYAKAQKETPPPPAAPKPQATKPVQRGVDPKKVEKQRSKWELEREKLRKLVAHSDRRRRALQRELDATQADISLREEAIRAGVQDIDIALMILRKHLSNKTNEELRTFDEHKFFEDLRTQRPALFAVIERPASTSPGNGVEAPKAPAPKTVTKTIANEGAVDARRLSREEFDKRLQQLGIQNPSQNPSY